MLTFLSLRHRSGHDRTVNFKVSDLDRHFESAIDDSNLGTIPPHVRCSGAIINRPGPWLDHRHLSGPVRGPEWPPQVGKHFYSTRNARTPDRQSQCILFKMGTVNKRQPTKVKKTKRSICPNLVSGWG